jgi:hypothetical protein
MDDPLDRTKNTKDYQKTQQFLPAILFVIPTVSVTTNSSNFQELSAIHFSNFLSKNTKFFTFYFLTKITEL